MNQLNGTVHRATLSECITTYTGVTVVNPANCTVHSPTQAAGTVATTKLMSFDVGSGNTMEVKFEPEVPPNFTTLEFAGPSCAINGVAATVTGSATGAQSGRTEKAGPPIIRSAGATFILNISKASEQLKVGGQKASLTATTTFRMEGGDPIGTTEEFIP